VDQNELQKRVDQSYAETVPKNAEQPQPRNRLKPCPECGHCYAQVSKYVFPGTRETPETTSYRVACACCLFETPKHRERENAIAEWNSR
jgi:hypothetical protein